MPNIRQRSKPNKRQHWAKLRPFSPPAFPDGYRDLFAIEAYGRAPTEVSGKRMLGRARIERLVYPRGTPSHRFRILCHEVRYHPCDNGPDIPKVLHSHRRFAYGDLETTHRLTVSNSPGRFIIVSFPSADAIRRYRFEGWLSLSCLSSSRRRLFT
jgi:hypothetical protein